MTKKEETTLYYNLGAVTRETGLHPDTLRAWERRYNLPQPTRSEGGQRLYSQRDMQIVQWLVDKQASGLRISQAADLWHTQVAAGTDPLQELNSPQSITPPVTINGDNVTAYRDAWVSAALSYDGARADQVMAEAFSIFPSEAVCLEILFGGLREIGEGWYQGKVTVQQEHYASALVTRKLNALIAGTAPPTRQETIVIAAPPEEDHMLASLLINYLLRRSGYPVIFLGADVPTKDFRDTIEQLNPSLVILTAHLLLTAASLIDLANQLSGLRTRLAYGGPIYSRSPELRQQTPGFFIGDTLQEVIPSIEIILSSPESEIIPSQTTIPDFLQELQHALPKIERLLAEEVANYPVIISAPTNLISRYLTSAIKLGNIRYLDSELEWVSGLLLNFDMPPNMLTEFLHKYAETIQQVAGESAQLVIDWLTQIANRLELEGNQ
ncbi:MAG: MerR family transcriptional regulator [Anaerolineales bacterium]